MPQEDMFEWLSNELAQERLALEQRHSSLLKELSIRLGPKTPRGPLGALEVLQLAKPSQPDWSETVQVWPSESVRSPSKTQEASSSQGIGEAAINTDLVNEVEHELEEEKKGRIRQGTMLMGVQDLRPQRNKKLHNHARSSLGSSVLVRPGRARASKRLQLDASLLCRGCRYSGSFGRDSGGLYHFADTCDDCDDCDASDGVTQAHFDFATLGLQLDLTETRAPMILRIEEGAIQEFNKVYKDLRILPFDVLLALDGTHSWDAIQKKMTGKCLTKCF
eukprot:s363_g13.t1